MKHLYSGKEVTKAGQFLQKVNSAPLGELEAIMDIVSYWRFCHEYPLNEALITIQNITSKIDPSAIFAKRLKRFPSIVKKLRRFDSMSLRSMQDIGGCRVIVKTPKKLDKVVRELRKIPGFKNSEGRFRSKDYIKSPKEDGYRSYHLIGKFPDEYGSTKNIEVQVRTVLQHDWATTLEIVDLFTNQALKSNQGECEWKQFFSNVSKQFSIMESIHMFDTKESDEQRWLYQNVVASDKVLIKSCAQVKALMKKLHVLKNLGGYANSIKIIDEKLSEDQKNQVGYVLIIIDTEKCTVTSYFYGEDHNSEAEKIYSLKEKEAEDNQHIVVALVSATSLGDIKGAYPNYFADSTDFVKYLSYIQSVDTKARLF